MIGKMTSQRSKRSSWSIEGLPATGPHSKLKSKLQLFGQFVGDWDIVDQTFPLTDRGKVKRTGKAHFNWILGGRAVQDVWGPIDESSGRFIPAGTTLRFYDEHLGAWRSTWISPLQQEVRRFVGRKVGSEIILKEDNRGLRTEHWIFFEIKRDSFKWRGMRKDKLGGPWRSVEEMTLIRRK
jgi:hypothetical protein